MMSVTVGYRRTKLVFLGFRYKPIIFMHEAYNLSIFTIEENVATLLQHGLINCQFFTIDIS